MPGYHNTEAYSAAVQSSRKRPLDTSGKEVPPSKQRQTVQSTSALASADTPRVESDAEAIRNRFHALASSVSEGVRSYAKAALRTELESYIWTETCDEFGLRSASITEDDHL